MGGLNMNMNEKYSVAEMYQKNAWKVVEFGVTSWRM